MIWNFPRASTATGSSVSGIPVTISHDSVEWRLIPGSPNYAVSSTGEVKRIAGGAGTRQGRLLKQIEARGYFHVAVPLDGKFRTTGIHRLVALAFIGPPPTPNHQAAHSDGNRKNNQPHNLRWATCKENHADKLRHGTWHHRTWNSKLNEVDVERIRDQARAGVSQKCVAAHFGVQSAHVNKIIRGLKWRQQLAR